MVPHSAENKRSLCEVRGFLPAIISLTAGAELVGVNSDVAMVESATGIIKYLSREFHTQYPNAIVHTAFLSRAYKGRRAAGEVRHGAESDCSPINPRRQPIHKLNHRN